jgi:hypothetical protein
MIIAGGLDSEDTEASAQCIRSALLCPSLRPEEADKAVRSTKERATQDVALGDVHSLDDEGQRGGGSAKEMEAQMCHTSVPFIRMELNDVSSGTVHEIG